VTLEDDTPGGVAMVTTHGHHLSAGVVEDDHIVLEGGHLLEDEELAYLQLMSDGEGRPPLVDVCVIAFSHCSHPLVAASVAGDDDVRRNFSEPPDKIMRDP
jgi:hypothetical protein